MGQKGIMIKITCLSDFINSTTSFDSYAVVGVLILSRLRHFTNQLWMFLLFKQENKNLSTLPYFFLKLPGLIEEWDEKAKKIIEKKPINQKMKLKWLKTLA